MDVSACPTSSSCGNSVFNHLVQAAEDPILEDFAYLNWFVFSYANSPAIRENRVTTVQIPVLVRPTGRPWFCSMWSYFAFSCRCHNPTGVDLTLQQWEQIRQLMRSRDLLPFFDNAFQVCKAADVAGRVDSKVAN
ncbi:hypothetical protein HS088_TW09G01330 [Tripterygium wilfordii]|uniref:Aminotransferase class I/classII large domain-containing protein n=1 Tax=Tripterygium wilfordii TaxID=458696 RepID=A0A7J7DAE5_TRIWF|nr:hypothetical protein HS088_TW09G01330 [Tripterygium wilfordii]